MLDTITRGLVQLDLAFTRRQVEQLQLLVAALVRWNKAYNLTAISDPEEILAKHIFDSLAPVPYLLGDTIIDVGTGAGLPGLPLALFFPNRQFILVDASNKKVRFLRQMIYELELANVEPQHGRIEQLPLEAETVISRAFASVEKMLACCDHLLAKGGHMQLMKGVVPQEELEKIASTYSVTAINSLEVPNLSAQRHLITLKKK